MRQLFHTRTQRKTGIGKTALLCGLLLLASILFTGCTAQQNDGITSLSQLGRPGTRIGVPGTMLEWKTLQEDYPDAEVIAYSDNPLGYRDAANGRLDAFVYARRQMELAIDSGTSGVRLLDENYGKNTIAVGLSPVSPHPGAAG